MVALPQPADPTLEAADRALEAKENAQRPRPYLGMSGIGEECSRKVFYRFRWCWPETFDALSLKRFADGHRTEDLQAERLRLVPGVTLLTVDPETGRQFGHRDLGGHFRGHMDGIISGILQAPVTVHVWEHKAVADKKQKELEDAKRTLGEKNALRKWNFTYYVQAVLYMHYSGLERHYLTCSTAGGRHTISVRTEPDPAEAMRQIAKARRIIFGDEPPERVSNDPNFYMCAKFDCSFFDICHGGKFPLRNCRTCLFAEPVEDGEGSWKCHRHDGNIPLDFQYAGCAEHRFNPALVPGEQTDAAADGSWVAYRLRSGADWVDEGEPHVVTP